MIHTLIEKIKDVYISDINFVDRNYGLVRTHREKVPNKDNTGTVEKVYPVYINQSTDDNKPGKEVHAIPESKYMSLSYHELTGAPSITPIGNGFFRFSFNVRNVWWINGSKCDATLNTIDTYMLNVIKNFPEHIGNFSNMAQISVEITGTEVTPSIFGAFSYDEANKQYLTPPYLYFAINYRLSCRIHKDCVDDITLQPTSC